MPRLWLLARGGTRQEWKMTINHDITEDNVFNLVSVQYHALHGSHPYAQFLDDVRQADHTE